MKIAALSDIHGNLAALDAVLDDVRRRGADVIVNLGDIVSGALHPAETADRLIALDLPTVKGNHERQLLTGERDAMRLSDRWAHDTLRADQFDWLAALPERLTLDGNVLMVHGTPDSDLVYFLETVTPDGCRAATPDEVAQRAGDTAASLILCGHTHVPRAARLDDGRLIVNPGSVGLQAYEDDLPHPHRIETGSPHARYAMVSRTAAGWNVEFHAVEYDWHTAAADALAPLVVPLRLPEHQHAMPAPSQLLFLPGASGSTAFWQPLAGRLTHPAERRIVAYPGFGDTPRDPAVDDFDGLVRHVLASVDRPTAVIAQSMGGVIATRAALDKPDLVTHLVLTVTSGGLDMAGLGAQDWRAGFAEANPRLPDWFMTLRADLSQDIGRIAQPTLLLWGDDDPISPVAAGRRLLERLPDARLHVVPGGRHDLAAVHAQALAPLVDQHLHRA